MPGNGRRGWFEGCSRAATAFLAPVVLGCAVALPAAALEGAAVERSAVIREHAGWNRNCEAIAAPPLFLITPPSHGKVCAKAQIITIASMQAGTESQCIGRKVSGVRLVYLPESSHHGEDAMVYGVQYPSRFQAISVKVDIGGTAFGKVSIEEAPQARRPPQLAGPMPVCPQLVF